MKRVLKRDIPLRATVAVVALVLLASVVKGRDDSATGNRSEPATTENAHAIPKSSVDGTTKVASIDLDLDKLVRPVKKGTANDLFLARSGIPAPDRAPLAAPATLHSEPLPPPKPTAPALPFTYLGRVTIRGKTFVVVSRNNEPLLVSEGDAIESLYKVERITDTGVTFSYLPLEQKQLLAIRQPD